MGDQENKFPSRANAKAYKARIANATKGLRLMKKKRDALELHMKYLEAKIKDVDNKVLELMESGLISLYKAKFRGIDFKPFLVGPAERASTFCKIGETKIVGVPAKSVSLVSHETDDVSLIGLSKGGADIAHTRSLFVDVLEFLILIGSVRLSLNALYKAWRDTSMRMNAIEHLLIPRMVDTLTYINNELEERDREDFFRLKRGKQRYMREEQRRSDTRYKQSQGSETNEGTQPQTSTGKEIEDLPQVQASNTSCLCPRRRVKKRLNIAPTEKSAQTDFK